MQMYSHEMKRRTRLVHALSRHHGEEYAAVINRAGSLEKTLREIGDQAPGYARGALVLEGMQTAAAEALKARGMAHTPASMQAVKDTLRMAVCLREDISEYAATRRATRT
jgi:hypothetical protein